MILSASYDEIIRLIREKSGHDIDIRYKDVDTLTISYGLPISIPILDNPLSHKISVDVKVIEFMPPRAVLRLDAGAAGNIVLNLASQRLLSKLPEGLVERFSDGCAVLNLDAVPRLKSLFTKMSVNALSFYSTTVSLDAKLK